jgi:uncharacterized membrane-anchored protein
VYGVCHICSWVKQKLSGLPIGENAALAIPVPVLLIILVAFLVGCGYVLMKIFDSDKQRCLFTIHWEILFLLTLQHTTLTVEFTDSLCIYLFVDTILFSAQEGGEGS